MRSVTTACRDESYSCVPDFHWTLYPLIGEPPSSGGSCQGTVSFPLPTAVAATLDGASGTQPPSRQGLRVTPPSNADSVAFWLSQ